MTSTEGTQETEFEAGEADEESEGNVQDFPHSESMNATLPPTTEGQDVSSLAPIVVPVPTYNDPNNPAAASGSLNMTVETHPVIHSEDYAADHGEGVAPYSPLDSHAQEVQTLLPEQPGTGEEDVTKLKASDWVERIDAASTQEEVDELRQQYDETDNDYATVEQAFERAEGRITSAG